MAKKTPSGAETAPILYTVIDPLRLDGADYQVGESIELTSDAAASLLAAKVIAPPAADLTVSND